jgi:hypothetical protein
MLGMKYRDSVPVTVNVYTGFIKIAKIFPDGSSSIYGSDAGESGIVDAGITEYLLSELSEEEKARIPGYAKPVRESDGLLTWLRREYPRQITLVF